jgi:guanylate kinase
MHYHFTATEAMQVEVDAGKFVETALVHGNLYGTSYDAVRRVSASGKVCILDIDTQGAQSVKKSSLHAHYIFIAPPSMDELERRLRGRGTESEEKVQLRLGGAKVEMDFSKKTGFFDKIIVNDDRERAYEEIKKVALGLTQ